MVKMMTQKRNVRIKASCDSCGAEQTAEAPTVDDAQQKLVDAGWVVYGFRPSFDYCRRCSVKIEKHLQELINHA